MRYNVLMNKKQKLALLLLRLATGWYMFYAGITKVMNPDWSAAGYLNSAKNFPEFYKWFASPEILPFVNFANEWGLTLLGISLILGVWVKLSSKLGIVLMLLYYFPILDGLKPDAHSFIVDQHIIFILILLFFAFTPKGELCELNRKFLKK